LVLQPSQTCLLLAEVLQICLLLAEAQGSTAVVLKSVCQMSACAIAPSAGTIDCKK